MTAQIRLAAPGELAALPELERSAGETFRGSVHDWVADHDVTPAEAYIPLQADGLVWVAEQDGAPVGFVACEVFGTQLHVWELAVRHDRQTQGLGRALMAAPLQAAHDRGLVALTLTTFGAIAWNAPFYERLGYRVIAERDLSPRLAQVLADEAGRGLTNRCAMILELGGPT